MKKIILTLSMVLCSLMGYAQQDGFLGEIRMFAGNFAPQGWAFCDGRLLQIRDNNALYAVLGIIYGGDGTTTFALPDLRGKVVIGPNTAHPQGHTGGSENITLTPNNIPGHNHSLPAHQFNPESEEHGLTPGNKSLLSVDNPSNTSILSGESGRTVPVNNMQPYLSINYIICINGTFPSRD